MSQHSECLEICLMHLTLGLNYITSLTKSSLISSSRSWVAQPFFSRIKRYICRIFGQLRRSFSTRSFPTNPVLPVIKNTFPSKNCCTGLLWCLDMFDSSLHSWHICNTLHALSPLTRASSMDGIHSVKIVAAELLKTTIIV